MVAQLVIADPGENVATTVNLPGGATGPGGTSANGIDTWNQYIEYGQPHSAASNSSGGTTASDTAGAEQTIEPLSASGLL